MEFSKYTENAINALSLAQQAAAELSQSFVGSEHLLLGILRCSDETSSVLKRHGIKEECILPYIDSPAGAMRNRFIDSYGNTQSVKRILELALYEAKSLDKELIGTEHLLLSIMRERDCMGARLIDTLCKNKQSLRDALLNGEFGLDDDSPVSERSENEGNDIGDSPLWFSCTVSAEKNNTVDVPKHHERTSKDASRAETDTPVLNSFCRDLTDLALNNKLDPVIGRENEIDRVILTLCRRIKNNPVLIGEPGVGKSAVAEGLAQRIADGRVPQMISGFRVLSLDLGAMIAGTKYRGEFEERLNAAVEELIDDKRTILFIDEIHTIVGAGAGEGSIDAANILKPSLARGEFRVIGATTIDEYRRYIEKDAALERRFSPILVSEPDADQARRILQGLKRKYEQHHNAVISDEAIEAAVELSIKYMADRRLPDKAIDLIDEAAAFVLLKDDPGDSTSHDNNSLTQLRQLIEKAASEGDFELAESLREESIAQNSIDNKGYVKTVTADDVENVVANRTGLNIRSMRSGLKNLETILNNSVYGQERAVADVAAVMHRSAAGLGYPEKPFGVLCFFGPDGCGKETLAVRLAEEFFNGSVVRLNGLEYADQGAAYKLIGAPSGYLDSEKGGALTEHVKLHPFSVIICKNCRSFSEDCLSILSRIASEGLIEDGRGRQVSFRSCVLVYLAESEEQKKLGFGAAKNDPGDRNSDLRGRIPDSLILSLDDSVHFNRLETSSLERIAFNELSKLAERAGRRGIIIEFADDLAAAVAHNCDNTAANIKKIISNGPEEALSLALLTGRVSHGDTAFCGYKNEEYFVERR